MKNSTLLLSIVSCFALTLGMASAGSSYDESPVSLTSTAPVSLSNDWVPLLSKGTQELSVGGRFDYEDFSELEYDLQISYGWFIADGWEFGLTGTFSDRNDVRNISGGLFTEYNFNRDSQWVPFIGFSAEWAFADVRGFDDFTDTNSALLGGEIGMKYFIRPNIAISGSIQFSWSSDDIFAVDDALKDSATTLLIGMRFYF